MTYTVWTKELLEPIIQSSLSYAECLRKMGKKVVGGNYTNLHKNIIKFNLDTSHMTNQAWNRGREHVTIDKLSRPIDIKKRLILKHGHHCWTCEQSKWNGQDIPLEIDHIDGNKFNNSLDNLQILCCNCHAQTKTWRGRKNKR